jgi:hypothetical protein
MIFGRNDYQQADKRTSPVLADVGAWIWLRLQGETESSFGKRALGIHSPTTGRRGSLTPKIIRWRDWIPDRLD